MRRTTPATTHATMRPLRGPAVRAILPFRPLALAAALFTTLAACERESPSSSANGAPPGSGVAVSPEIGPPAPAPASRDARAADAVALGARIAAPETQERATPLPGTSAATAGAGDVVAPTMVIRTGTATVEVRQLDPAIAAVQTLAQRLGGWVGNVSVQGGDEQLRSATLELKIPASRFDAAIAGLRPIGEVEAVNVDAQDVGEEYVDLSARVANARRLEQRLLELLERRTGRLEDVLQVERELARVREEIERLEGRLRYLRTRAAISTLVVMLHEPGPVVGGLPGESPIRDAFREAWRNLVGFVAGVIAALGWLIPLALLVAVVAWGLRRAGVWPVRWRGERE